MKQDKDDILEEILEEKKQEVKPDAVMSQQRYNKKRKADQISNEDKGKLEEAA